MVYLVGALIVAYVAREFLRTMAQGDPAQRAALIAQAGGMAALVSGAFLMVTGRLALGAGIAVVGFWRLASVRRAAPIWPSRGRTGVSRMRSAMIEMEYDQSAQRLRGAVLVGEFEGRQLDQMTRVQCLTLHRLALYQDAGGARLLEAYLDRRFPGWRLTREGQGDPGFAGAGDGEAGRPGGAMTQDEAYQVLGLRYGAGRQDIVRAHRGLMKKWHPDHGGSTDVAARVNEAKDVLLRLHH